MSESAESETEALLSRAANGDRAAGQQLLLRYRDRLKRMVEVHLDRRVASRLDPSDIVQEALAEAAQKLSSYMSERPLPFYPWIRQLALDHIVDQHRKHIGSRRRSVTKELAGFSLPNHSSVDLARRLMADSGNPAEQLARREVSGTVQRALDRLDPADREVLVLRYLEQLSAEQAAQVMGLTVPGVKSRQRRAIQRFAAAFSGLDSDNS